MGLRQRIWAKKTRDKLLKSLGGRCFECGTREELELDCIEPQGDSHHKMEYSWRMSFYRKQYFNFNLQILCKRHNAIKEKTEPKVAF